MITEILEYLNEAPNNFTTSTRIKKKIENIPNRQETNAVDYGRKLSFMKSLGLIENKKNSWRITERGQKWVKGDLDLRDI